MSKYIVIKISDALKYLTPNEQLTLRGLARIIELGREKEGKEPSPSYYVVNQDESYAGEVRELIAAHHSDFQNDERIHRMETSEAYLKSKEGVE